MLHIHSNHSSSVLIHSADNTSKSRGRSFFLHANEQKSNFSTRKQQSKCLNILNKNFLLQLLLQPIHYPKKLWKNWFKLCTFLLPLPHPTRIQRLTYIFKLSTKISQNAWISWKKKLLCPKYNYSTSNMKNFRGLKTIEK